MKNEIEGQEKAVNRPEASMNTQSEAASRPSKKLQVDQKAAGQPKLAKAETVALWYAVNWMEVVLREWQRGGFKNEQDQAQHEVERQRLTDAKRALRKVNQIRKEQ